TVLRRNRLGVSHGCFAKTECGSSRGHVIVILEYFVASNVIDENAGTETDVDRCRRYAIFQPVNPQSCTIRVHGGAPFFGAAWNQHGWASSSDDPPGVRRCVGSHGMVSA